VSCVGCTRSSWFRGTGKATSGMQPNSDIPPRTESKATSGMQPNSDIPPRTESESTSPGRKGGPALIPADRKATQLSEHCQVRVALQMAVSKPMFWSSTPNIPALASPTTFRITTARYPARLARPNSKPTHPNQMVDAQYPLLNTHCPRPNAQCPLRNPLELTSTTLNSTNPDVKSTQGYLQLVPGTMTNHGICKLGRPPG
jgi:hypothetical protein